MVQLTSTMIRLANVFQTVGGPLATAEALLALATTHHRVYGQMKACARVYGEYILWWYLLSTHASWYKYYVLQDCYISLSKCRHKTIPIS